jgi:hypothetical protein
VIIWPLASSSFVDQCGKVFVTLQEVAMYAGAGDDRPAVDPPIVAAQLGDSLETHCS